MKNKMSNFQNMEMLFHFKVIKNLIHMTLEFENEFDSLNKIRLWLEVVAIILKYIELFMWFENNFRVTC